MVLVMTPKEKMVAKKVLSQLTNDKITPDEALGWLDSSLEWSDALFEWGFVNDNTVQNYVDGHNDDFRWLRNFLEGLEPEQKWHYIVRARHRGCFINDHGTCDGTPFKECVINFIEKYTED